MPTSKRKDISYDLNSTSHPSSIIACNGCARTFSTRRGYRVHISNNNLCMLSSLSTDSIIKYHTEGNQDNSPTQVSTRSIDTHEETLNGNHRCNDSGMIVPADNDSNDSFGMQNVDDPSSESVKENDPCSSDILQQNIKHRSRPDNVISTHDIHAAKLAKILHKANVPLYLFDSIMTWASQSTMENYKFPHTPQSRICFFQKLYSTYDLQGIGPVLKCIHLPCSGRVIDVVTF